MRKAIRVGCRAVLAAMLILVVVAVLMAASGVSSYLRYGSALPSGAPQYSVFILTSGPAIYICNNSPTCTSSGQWIGSSSIGGYVAVSNTSTTVNAATTGVQTIITVTPAAGQFNTTNSSFEIYGFGSFTPQNGSTSITFYSYLNGNYAGVNSGTSITSLQQWEFHATCSNTSSNTYQCANSLKFNPAGGGDFIVFNYASSISYSSGPIGVAVAFSSSSSSNTATQLHLRVKQLS